MELAEAVRIVREKLVPIWFGLPIGLALETVLAAVAEAQRAHGALDATFARLFPDWQTVAPPEGKPLRVFLLERQAAEVERLTQELAEVRLERAGQYEMTQREREIAKAAEAEVERLRMEFRRIEECAAAMLAGERSYAQVMKLLHEAPRAALAPVQPCDQCDPSFGCFDGREPCRKVEPYLASTSSTLICGPDRYVSAQPEERHWQNDADPKPGRAQAAYQAQRERDLDVLSDAADDLARMEKT